MKNTATLWLSVLTVRLLGPGYAQSSKMAGNEGEEDIVSYHG
jgi:hypothetical protein